jgi:hypothetical protein
MMTTSMKRQTRRPIQGVEALEQRVMLDGNVTASLTGGDLTVRGDAQDNHVLITRRSSGKIRIAGEEDTAVNGRRFVDLPQMSDDLLILMRQGGADHVEIQGRFAVPGDLNAQLGAGELLIEGTSGPVEIAGDLIVSTDEDGHVTLRNEVEAGGGTSVESGGDVNFVGGLATVPNFAAARFGNGLNINNPYFPVVPGAKYRYVAEGVDEDTGEPTTQNVLVEMLPQTRTIAGVQVRVVRDRVFEEGRLVEDTFDFYAQDDNGNVWYFGEDVTNYEYDAQGNFTTNKDGSWLAGKEGAQAGIIMEASPRIGFAYYQEVAPGKVLDQGVGLRKNERVTVPAGTFNKLFRTEESSVVEPFSLANKLYAPGVGTVMEFDLDIEDDEVTQTMRLVSLELNGKKVARVVPAEGFKGVNATGRFVGGPRSSGAATIDATGPVVLRGSTFEDELNVQTPEVVIVADSTLDGHSLFRTRDTLTLRGVDAEGTIELAGNPDEAFIFDSDIDTFKANFGGGNDLLVVKHSELDVLDADGGSGTNTFEDRGGNEFETLRLRRFARA